MWPIEFAMDSDLEWTLNVISGTVNGFIVGILYIEHTLHAALFAIMYEVSYNGKDVMHKQFHFLWCFRQEWLLCGGEHALSAIAKLLV